jgi:hypothetical protein
MEACAILTRVLAGDYWLELGVRTALLVLQILVLPVNVTPIHAALETFRLP